MDSSEVSSSTTSSDSETDSSDDHEEACTRIRVYPVKSAQTTNGRDPCHTIDRHHLTFSIQYPPSSPEHASAAVSNAPHHPLSKSTSATPTLHRRFLQVNGDGTSMRSSDSLPNLAAIAKGDNGDSSKTMATQKKNGTLRLKSKSMQRLLDRLLHHNSGSSDSLHRLHKVTSVRDLLHELQRGADANATNDQHDSPLHSIVKRQFQCKEDKQKMLLALLMHSEANVNQKTTHGITALHLAVQAYDLATVETLVAFGANINSKDDYNCTPFDLVDEGNHSMSRHPSDDEQSQYLGFESEHKKLVELLRSVGALRGRHAHDPNPVPPFLDQGRVTGKEKSEEESDFTDQFEKGGLVCEEIQTGNPLPYQYRQVEQYIEQRLLNISIPLTEFEDEALSLAMQMRELRMYKQANGSRILFLDGGGIRGLVQIEILSQLEEHTGRKIKELFDWIVGTSTGGVIALAMVYAKKSLNEIRRLYFKMKDEVFGKSVGFSYDTDALEKILKEELGEEICMSDVTYPRVLIPAVKKEFINLKLHFFNNCFNDEYSTQPVWLVARCTSAAPVLFNEQDNYVDGGILANNPSECGLTKIQSYYRSRGEKLPISVVVSVGSGKNPMKKLGSTGSNEGFLLGARGKNLLTLLTTALGESETIANNCECRCQEQGIHYFRLNPRLHQIISPGETDNKKLIDMILQTRREICLRHEFSNLVLSLHKLSQASRIMQQSL